MLYEAETAFVLHARAWRETSLLVELLTEHHGRVGALAKGTTGARKHSLRAALQPLQHVRFSATQQGELAQLRQAEALDAAPLLSGDAMPAAFYLNELTLRLTPRQDPYPDIYAAYARTRERLRAQEPTAWTLRRYERDLLQALGFGFSGGVDGDGLPLDPAARYVLDPEHGPRKLGNARAGDTRLAATGRALLALAADTPPDPDDARSLRSAMRPLLLHHLGGRGLKSWELPALRKSSPRAGLSDETP